MRLLIFDLDGTLIDSRRDLVLTVNATLAHLGRPLLPESVIAENVGDGAALLVRRSLGLAPPPDRSRPPQPLPALPAGEQALVDRALEYFLAFYADHKLDYTQLYPGVDDGLASLAGAGFAMAVLTNKPVRASREIIAGLGVADRFSAVYGGNSFAAKKPDPIGITTLLEQHQLDADAAAMIGDSAVDVQTARQAGAVALGVSYGFAPESLALQPPDWCAASFPELCAPLLAARASAR